MAEEHVHPDLYDVQYLEVAAQVFQKEKQLTYVAMRLEPGHRVLDVGCGPGLDTVSLAALVGASGRVDGVDADSEMLAEADQRAAAAGLQDIVHHHLADALALPFDSNTFDSSRSERLFQHLSDPAAALAEMRRVTRPGGRIVVLDSDWSSVTIDSDETDVERRLAQAASVQRAPYVARKLYRMFVDHDLNDIALTVHPMAFTSYALIRLAWLDLAEQNVLAAGIVTEDELRTWRTGLEQANARNAFFACCNLILVSGSKL